MSPVDALLTVAVVPTRAELASIRFISKRLISQNGRPFTSISVMSKKASPLPDSGRSRTWLKIRWGMRSNRRSRPYTTGT